MNTQRALAFLLFLVPLGTLTVMSREILIAALTVLFAAAGATGHFRFALSRGRHAALLGVLTAAVIASWILLPPIRPGGFALQSVAIGMIDYNFACRVAQGVLVYQACLFYRRGGLPAILPFYAAAATIMAGTIPAAGFQSEGRVLFQAASLALATLTGVYYYAGDQAPEADAPLSTSRFKPRKTVLLAVLLLAIGGSGWALGKGIYRYAGVIDQSLGQLIENEDDAGGTVGFSTEGRLGTIDPSKIFGANRTVLRVLAEQAPGYLRGKAFDTFQGARWACSLQPLEVLPIAAQEKSADDPAIRWFRLRSSVPDEDAALRMTLYPAASLTQAVFAPLDAAWLRAPAKRLSINAYGIPEGNQLPAGAPYQVRGIAAPVPPPSGDERARLMALPGNLDPRVAELARQITAECRSDAEKVHAIAAYLVSHCTYDLAAGPAFAQDPVAAFLFSARRGHCQFFATAAAILLRCSGVPCRYVSGFAVSSQNAYGGYWVARNKDAHAWVEAYLEGRGWTVVEATPAAGVPSDDASALSQGWDYLKYKVQATLAALRSRAFAAWTLVAANAWRAVLGVLAILLAAYGLAFARRWFRRARQPADPLTLALRQLLAKMDRRYARRGFVRAPAETLHRFAQRIASQGHEPAAAWYRAYAALRYGPACAAYDIEALRRELPRE